MGRDVSFVGHVDNSIRPMKAQQASLQAHFLSLSKKEENFDAILKREREREFCCSTLNALFS